MSSLDGFNAIAPYYDSLKRLVFGKTIFHSQVHFLRFLRKGGKILVLGGGSGEILRPLLEENPDCTIWYVEASSEMLAQARKNSGPGAHTNILFIHGTERMLTKDVIFDAVVAQFFFDLFPEVKLREVCGDLHQRLTKAGVVLVTDFVDGGKWWQHILLRAMYKFFRIASGIAVRRLPDWEEQLRLADFTEAKSQFFYGGFIKASIWRRSR